MKKHESGWHELSKREYTAIKDFCIMYGILNQEMETIKKWRDMGQVNYIYQGPFTIANVIVWNGSFDVSLWSGTTKRNRKDKPNREQGEILALTRALFEDD